MVTTKKAVYRVCNGTDYDIIHFETEASQVKTAGGSDVETVLTGKAAITQPTRISPTLLNSWANGANTSLTYWKDTLGYVHFEGKVNNPSAVSGNVFLLPTGYRSAFEVSFPIYAQYDSSIYRCIIVPTGEVYIQTTSGGQNIANKDYDLSTVIFRA